MENTRKKLTDEELHQALNGDREVSIEENLEIIGELLGHRRRMRHDSRRAEQIRRMRWTVENLLQKVEALDKRNAQEETAKEPQPCEP